MNERKASRRSGPKTETRAPARAPFTLGVAWAAGILAVLVVLFFHEVVVGGKTFVAPDATAPAGFVRLGEQSLYQDKVYPLWNPYVFLGMPSFASGAYNPLIYPPDWPVAIAQKLLPLPELTWMLLYYFLAGLFAFLLAREWGARPEGALIGAAVFTFVPNLIAVGAHGHGSQMVNSAYLPLMLWLTSRWMRRGRWTDLGWLAIAGGFQLLRGHVQICFYSWMAVGLYVLADLIAGAVRAREPAPPSPALPLRTARALAIAAAAALAFGIAGFYNLPLREYAHWSIRGGGSGGGVGMTYATSWSMAPYELPAVVVPGWAGFGGATYWGSMPFTDYPNAFTGIVALLLALAAAFATGWRRAFALGLALLAMVISFGRYFPVYGLLYEHLPLFNKFRIPVMVVLLFHMAVALGAAWGWSAILDARRAPPERTARWNRVLAFAAAGLGVLLVSGVFLQDLWRAGYIERAIRLRTAIDPGYNAQLAGIAYQNWVGDLARACLYGLATIGIAWFVVQGRLAGRLASAGILVLVLIEMWPVGGKLMLPVLGDPVRRSLETGRDDVVQFLEQAGPPGTFRILPIEEFQDNRYSGFAIASVGGYHAAKPQRIQDLFDAQLQFNPYWQRLLNVRFLVTRQTVDPPPPQLRLAFAGSQNVYENLVVLPRATLVEQYEVVTPARAILDSVATGAADAALVTFLEEDPGVELGSAAGGVAVISHYGLNRVVVDVDTPGRVLLRLADAWYPDWVVTVDGQPASLLRADYLLRAVVVPAGKHQVEFRFASGSVRAGLTLSLVSLVLVAGLLGAGIWQERRRPAGAPAPV